MHKIKNNYYGENKSFSPKRLFLYNQNNNQEKILTNYLEYDIIIIGFVKRQNNYAHKEGYFL
jgi:hypothetical protein